MTIKGKLALCILVTAVFVLPTITSAQTWDYVPVGPRTVAMGGTGLAVATGDEAFMTNPALIGWNGQTILSLAIRTRGENVMRSDFVGTIVDGTTTRSHLAALVLPLPVWDDRVTFGIAHTRPVEPIYNDFGFDGGVEMISPSVAVQVMDGWRIGAAVNIWTGKLTFEGDSPEVHPFVYSREDGSIIAETDWEDIELSGLNATIGTQVTLYEHYEQHKVYLGAAARLPFKLNSDPNSMRVVNGLLYTFEGKEDIDMPLTLGTGLGWLINNRVTIATDFEYRIWDEPYEYTRVIDWFPGPVNDSVTLKVPNAEHTWQLGAGAEYAIPFENFEIPLRMGYRHFTMPFLNEDDSPVGAEALSLGIGFRSELFQFNLAYQKSSASHILPVEFREIKSIEERVSYGYNTFIAGAAVNLSELW